MNKNIFVIMLLICAMICISCQKKYKMVPEPVLQDIITESLITDAILNESRKKVQPTFSNAMNDTTDYYEPIVRKHGYTAADVKYTISVMSSRKSNPLNHVLNKVVENIDLINKRAEYHYRAYLKFDSLALNYYKDTLYNSAKKITGAMAKANFHIMHPRSGEYEVKFDYMTSSDYRVRPRRLRYRQPAKDSIIATAGSFYINKSNAEKEFTSKFHLRRNGADSLIVSFDDSYSEGGQKSDSSYVTNILLIYTPPVKIARENYYTERTGFNRKLIEYYENKYFQPQDSIPFPIFGTEEPDSTKLDSRD